MAKRRREPDSDTIVSEFPESNAVFVDTSLDTHLVILVSSSDTVSDFKKNMAMEHKLCFPTFGEIQILSVKVARRSNFYNLPDIMPLRSVFHGVVTGNWFLSADVCWVDSFHSIKNSSDLDDNCRVVSPDVNGIQVLPMPLDIDVATRNVESEMLAEDRFENTMEETSADFRSKNCLDEKHFASDNHSRKKRRLRKTEDTTHNSTSDSENAHALLQKIDKDTSEHENVSCGNLKIDTTKENLEGGILLEQNERSVSDAIVEVSIVRNDHLEGTHLSNSAQNSLGSGIASQNPFVSNEMKNGDNVLESKVNDELAHESASKYLDGVSIDVVDRSTILMDTGSGVRKVDTFGSKRKRRRKSETTKRCSESSKSGKKEEEYGSFVHDDEVIMALKGIASDHLDPKLMLDVDAIIEPEISCGINKEERKKKMMWKKKSLDTNPETSGVEQTENRMRDSSGLLFSSTDRFPEETGNEQGILHNHGVDVQMPLDSSSLDARETARGINNEVDFDVCEGQSLRNTAEKSNSGSPMTSQNISASHVKKKEDNLLEYKLDAELTQDGPTKHMDGTSVNVPDHSAMDAGGAMREVNADVIKRKKRKVLRTSGVQDTTDMQQTGKGETMKTYVETPKSKLKEKDETLPFEHDDGIVMPSKRIASDHLDPNLMLDVDAGMEAKISIGVKKKQKKMRKKKSDNTNRETSDVDKLDNCISGSGLLPLSTDVSVKTGKEEGITHHEGEGVQMLLDSTHLCTPETVINTCEADSVMLTQSKQALEDLGYGEKKADKKSQSPANCHADTPALGTISPILECNQVGWSSENTGNKDRKASNKRKKRKLTSSEVQVGLPVEDQLVGLEREGINFKEYFMPGQDQHKVDSGGKVKKAIKSKMETSKRMKDNDLPSVCNSPEPPSSIKSFENIKFDNRKDRSMSKRGSGQGVEVFNPRHEITLQKPDDSLAASSCLNKKNQTSYKSTLVRSEILSRKQGNKRLQLGLNVTNAVVMKTPQKKSLFAKSGAIFKDRCGESSGDENGIMNSDGSTVCPSNSSSVSGDSVGDSDLSLDSTANESNAAEGKSTGRRNMSKLELSASKELTMDMILRSSKRFKKAKLQASENEDVPESQLS